MVRKAIQHLVVNRYLLNVLNNYLPQAKFVYHVFCGQINKYIHQKHTYHLCSFICMIVIIQVVHVALLFFNNPYRHFYHIYLHCNKAIRNHIDTFILF